MDVFYLRRGHKGLGRRLVSGYAMKFYSKHCFYTMIVVATPYPRTQLGARISTTIPALTCPNDEIVQPSVLEDTAKEVFDLPANLFGLVRYFVFSNLYATFCRCCTRHARRGLEARLFRHMQKKSCRYTHHVLLNINNSCYTTAVPPGILINIVGNRLACLLSMIKTRKLT